MVTRNVVLTGTQDQLVQTLVSSGRYHNVSEAMRAGPRLLEHEEAQLAEIRHGLLDGALQARVGVAEGSGADAIREPFRQARTASGHAACG
ncbi:type II toxin-antitoxin system ParD family antitoxin [Thioclava sp. BHET1]|nr:type II toxin-antitoxin system ParD family antitoxin [Thioclava sp. BHET1]